MGSLFNLKKGGVEIETLVKVVLALGFLTAGILIFMLLRGRSESIGEYIKNVFSFSFVE